MIKINFYIGSQGCRIMVRLCDPHLTNWQLAARLAILGHISCHLPPPSQLRTGWPLNPLQEAIMVAAPPTIGRDLAEWHLMSMWVRDSLSLQQQGKTEYPLQIHIPKSMPLFLKHSFIKSASPQSPHKYPVLFPPTEGGRIVAMPAMRHCESHKQGTRR